MSESYSITREIAIFGAVREIQQDAIVELICEVHDDVSYADIKREVARIYAEVLGYEYKEEQA